MFRITPERTDGHVVLKVEGRVSADALDELDACWRALTAEPGAAPVWIDLSDASLVGTIGLDRLGRGAPNCGRERRQVPHRPLPGC